MLLSSCKPLNQIDRPSITACRQSNDYLKRNGATSGIPMMLWVSHYQTKNPDRHQCTHTLNPTDRLVGGGMSGTVQVAWRHVCPQSCQTQSNQQRGPSGKSNVCRVVSFSRECTQHPRRVVGDDDLLDFVCFTHLVASLTNTDPEMIHGSRSMSSPAQLGHCLMLHQATSQSTDIAPSLQALPFQPPDRL